MVGEVGTPNAQFLICVEKEIIFESKTFIDIFDIIGTYLTYVITSNCFLFYCFFNVMLLMWIGKKPKKIPDTLANFLRLVN